MLRFRTLRLTALGVPSALLVASLASAHIELLEPASRYPSTGNKSCPCGEGDSNRRCEVPAEESSDPNRSTDPAKVTTFEAGSTITVRFDEYIGHSGRFRVAFDAEGADLADFNDRVLVDVADPADGQGMREIEVTLPDMSCENCTLQLIQAMHGDTENPVADPAPLSTYYACADIVLVPKGSLGGGTADPDDEERTTDAGTFVRAELGNDEGGCSLVPVARRGGAWALLLLGLGALVRRRGR